MLKNFLNLEFGSFHLYNHINYGKKHYLVKKFSIYHPLLPKPMGRVSNLLQVEQRCRGEGRSFQPYRKLKTGVFPKPFVDHTTKVETILTISRTMRGAGISSKFSTLCYLPICLTSA